MFKIEILISLFLSLIFWIIFFGLSIYWSRMKYKEWKINLISAIVVSTLYTFFFFFISSCLLILLSLFKVIFPKIKEEFLNLFKV